MDNSGQANSQQLRPPSYGDLCRPPGAPTDSSALSAAYHSRYLASLPLSSGAGFPFFSSMLAGALPTPPSPFRAPSAPGVGNMRQFWPPTPPPDGYGRYGMNSSLFPLFGSVSPSPDSGTYMTQGLVSRLGTAGHLPHLIDNHKDPTGYYTSGYSLGTPLTPSSHVTPTTHFSHLIPPLEKHPSYGHMTYGTKELEDVHDGGDLHSPSRVHLDCCRPDIPYKYTGNSVKSKGDNKHFEKNASECRKSSPSFMSKDRPEEIKPFRGKSDGKYSTMQSPSKVSPCEIDISCNPSIKPDILSPPIDSPRSDVPPSPSLLKKQDISPSNFMSPPLSSPSSSSQSSMNGNSDSNNNKCSACVANSKGFGLKVDGCCAKISSGLDMRSVFQDSTDVASNHSTLSHGNQATVVSTWSTTNPKPSAPETTSTSPKSSFSEGTMMKETLSNSFSLRSSPSKPDVLDNQDTVFHGTQHNSNKQDVDAKSPITALKHVTAAVIPTAPKQNIMRETSQVQPLNVAETMSPKSSVAETFSSEFPQSQQNTLQKVKCELIDSSAGTMNPREQQTENLPAQQLPSNCCKYVSKNSSLCKVKDMIKAIDCSQKASVKPSLSVVSSKEPKEDLHVTVSVNAPANAAKVMCTSDTSMPCSSLQVNGVDKSDISSIGFCENRKSMNLLKSNSPSFKAESSSNSFECQFSQSSSMNWTKATVSPFSWQKNTSNCGDEQQAINLTMSRKNENIETQEKSDSRSQESSSEETSSVDMFKSVVENDTTPIATPGSGIIGVCHPNTKTKVVQNCTNKYAAVTAQPEITTEVHVSMKTSVQTVQHSSTPPLGMKNNVLNSSFHAKTMKSERITTKRGKLGDTEKILPSSRNSLATLAPKLTKKIGFLKEGKSSHTLSTSSSMSSTSIVFPASVNPCIPVGIAIAQQRQDTTTSANVGKTQTSVQSSTSGLITSTTHLTSNRVGAEIQPPQDIVREQKAQDIGCTSSTNSTDAANFLVAQGPTIVSRQWESEAVTRATLPSPWMNHGPVVAPALWIGQVGQSTYTATPSTASTAIAPAPVNSLETAPVSLPPGGYQLARDSVTGHLFLIPAANIVDRTPVWPSYNAAAGSTLPIQQLVAQQHHTQFEQVLPQVSDQEHVQDCLSVSVRQTQMGETSKDLSSVDTCCLSSNDGVLNNSSAFKSSDHHGKLEDKSDSNNSVPSVPLASGQTFTFTTFPTNCDPSGFSYVLQSSTVMHLAHTQTTASIQTESGKRSQGTSPLHSASPSPPPNGSSVQVMEDDIEEESDNDNEDVACAEMTQVKLSQQCQSVTTAIQVDMDAQTYSEAEEEEDVDARSDIVTSKKVEMSDSANQTEGGLSDSSAKADFESDSSESFEDLSSKSDSCKDSNDMKQEEKPPADTSVSTNYKSPEQSSSDVQIVTQEEEPVPLLPAESKNVMDFIDHHGLNLLVDSIEEFASREKDTAASCEKLPELSSNETDASKQHHLEPESLCDKGKDGVLSAESGDSKLLNTVNETPRDISSSTSYRTIDTSCTDGLGLLCALAEQRFFEESLNCENAKETSIKPPTVMDDPIVQPVTPSRTVDNAMKNVQLPSSDAETGQTADLNPAYSFAENFPDPFDMTSTPADLRACELEMRKRLADLQKEYKEKQLELARLAKLNNGVCVEEKLEDVVSKPKASAVLNFKHKSSVPGKNRSSFTSTHSFKVKAGKKLLSNTLLTKKALLQKKKFKRGLKSMLMDRKRKQRDSSAVRQSSESCKTLQENTPSKKIGTPVKARINKSINATLVPKEKSEIKKPCGEKKVKNPVKSQQDALPKKPLKKKSIKIEAKPIKKQKSAISTSNCETKVKKPEERSLKTPPETSERQKQEPKQKEDRPKKPFFDEQAWLVRRSERIFLSDTKVPVPQTPSNNVTPNTPKKTSVVQVQPKPENGMKEKKEKPKSSESVSSMKKRHVSESSVYSKSSELSSSSLTDSECSDDASSQSDNVPLSVLVEQCAAKNEKAKRLSTDSDSSDASFHSTLSDDIPLSALIAQNNSQKATELRSCILTPSDLKDKTRVLILDEGLFYAGHIISVQEPDVYGIILDGERAHRPHIFSREEMLNAAVLEVKPTHPSQVSEGCRICAFWSQQYRCLYPGTVTKASSPIPDASLLSVEFDDGDSGRIPLEDIRMLPPEFPIVSMEPNPLLILGKRRARSDKESASEQKSQNCLGQKSEKNTLKLKKKRPDGSGSRISQDSTKIEGQESSFKLSKPCSFADQSSHSGASAICGESSSSKSSHSEVRSKESKKRNSSDSNPNDDSSSSLATTKPKKHKKHKDDHKHHHHHHHHRHHHHHHKKHKSDRENSASKCDSEKSAVISVNTVSSEAKVKQSTDSVSLSNHQRASNKDVKVASEKKSELTVKIKTSPSPHTTTELDGDRSKGKIDPSVDSSSDSSLSDQESDSEKVVTQQQKNKSKRKKVNSGENKPNKRKDRVPVEKSKIAAFLPVRQLWRWSGKGYRRPGAKGKGKKEFYRAIQRGKELLRVGDSAVFLSTGRPHLPYIGRIETMWESWGGKMDVKVKWFYHPEETKNGKKLTQLKGALFQSPHFDENDVQTISHKCEVLSWEEYQARKAKEGTPSSSSTYGSIFDNNDIYYLAGTYDPITGSLIMEPGVPKIPALEGQT